jgi:hypothetical protein
MIASGERRAASGARLFLLAACCSLLASQNVSAISDNAGTKNGNFLKIPTDARGVALGPTMVSMAEGSEGLRWNPAALAKLETKELSATHILYYQDVSVENASFAYPLEESGLGVSVFYLSPGTLDGRNVLGYATGDFKFYDLVGSLGYGRKVFTRNEGADVYLGAAVKIVQEAIAEQQFQNPALDVGAMVSPWEDFNAGFSLRNFASGKANFPKEIVGGVSYTALRALTGALALRYTNDAPVRLGLGAEYKFSEYQTVVRAGYQTHDVLDNSIDSAISALRSGSLAGLTLGTGFEYRPPILQRLLLNLDYTIAPFGALGISHTVTVKMKW